MSTHSRSRSLFLFLLLIILLMAFAVSAAAAKVKEEQVSLAGYELIGTVNFPTGFLFAGTEVGGLSSITYDARREV